MTTASKTMGENQAFVKAVIDSVEEKGRDYVFEGQCRYFREDTKEPACLFGHALHKVGYDLDDIQSMKCGGFTSTNATIADIVLETMGYHPAIGYAAASAQAIQDGRTNDSVRGTWGKSLDRFFEALKEFDPSGMFLLEGLSKVD